jgi:hypothetical protein
MFWKKKTLVTIYQTTQPEDYGLEICLHWEKPKENYVG